MSCIRCHRANAELVPGRRHCRICQRLASRLAYYRNRFARLEQINRRRAAQYGCALADVDYAALYAAQIGQPCGICGATVTPADYEFDHTQPLADGGAHAPANIRLIHRTCNRAASMRRFVLARVLNRSL